VFDWSKLLPPLTLYVHVANETVRAGPGAVGSVVRCEGEDPITWQFLHDRLKPLHALVVTPVLDLAGQTPVDAYEIPDRHRHAVHLRTPADCFPYSATVSRGLDIDHTRKWTAGQPGMSRLDNYGPLGRFNHRVKTHGRWTVRQPFAGIYLWRDPHGQLYLVDHTGTHKLTDPGQIAGPATDHDPDLEIYPHPDLRVVLDFDQAG